MLVLLFDHMLNISHLILFDFETVVLNDPDFPAIGGYTVDDCFY